VFRYMHGGEPVEVSKAEAEMLIFRHRQRQEVFKRIVVLTMIGMVVFVLAFPRLAWLLPVAWIGGLIFGMPAYYQWAYKDLTKHLQQRPSIGMKLDFSGRFIRRVEMVRWRDLGLAFAGFAVISGPTLARAGTRFSDWPMLLIDMVVLTLLLLTLVIKWGQGERRRMHERNLEEMRRLRDWR